MKIHDIVALVGGIGLFLFGLQLMVNKLERVFGRMLRILMPAMTKNRVTGLFAGTVATGILQSSSGVTAATVGLVHAGVMTAGCALGVILGANIGSTATGLLLCLNTQWSMMAAAAGLVLVVISRRDRIRQAGQLLMSAGVMLFGLQLMTESMAILKDWQGVTYLTMGMDYPGLSILLGAGVAAMLQSSAAAIGILQALCMQGILPLDTALYALLGMNIGTCITAVIAAAGANVPARRTAAVHVLFNLLTAALAMAAMHYLPVVDFVQGMGVQVNLKLALTHVILNVGGAAVWLVLSPVLLLLSRIFAHGKVKNGRLKHYDERQLSVPFIALYQLEKEVRQLGEAAQAILQQAIGCWQGTESISEGEAIAEAAKEIAQGLLLVQGKTSNERDSVRIAALLRAAAQFEYAARHAQAFMRLSENSALLGEEETDAVLLLAHKALGAVETAQTKAFSCRISREERQSMKLLAADAQRYARELTEQCAARQDNCAAYQTAVQEIACVTEAMGQLID